MCVCVQCVSIFTLYWQREVVNFIQAPKSSGINISLFPVDAVIWRNSFGVKRFSLAAFLLLSVQTINVGPHVNVLKKDGKKDVFRKRRN